MMKLVIASNNLHKIAEIKEIFADLNLEVVSYHQVFPDFVEVEEDGVTFEANALKKARTFAMHPEHIYLADDSGLEVAALNNEPGIYSARYAGEGATKTDLCQKILRNLAGNANRAAQFRSVIALKFPDGNCQVVEGILKGTITQEMRGENGFGYDAIFVPEGYTKTLAEMAAEEKNQLSHRFLALQQARKLIAVS
jgi:non-canonical purine NTP pyrophosphatase (RdgB/HAM1 family)